MRKFEYIRYYVCDVCGKVCGSKEPTILSENSAIPEARYPRTWSKVWSKDGEIRLSVCNDHNVLIDGKTVGEVSKDRLKFIE